ncbi:cytochrome-c oxidase, cbb3-type subunit I [Asticcacaulis sp. 201]|nr:cytochrome-c oxidase, cbb3-type subunit I [Asticcacaulis sp. 201]MDV6331118.1 cytochrome-c oxidase, cbb3-type subunit I [Asticcacaulis sp. 201]
MPAAPAPPPRPAPRYEELVIKYFTIASMFWAIAGFAVGLLLAIQLAFPVFNIEPYLNFGRLRPLHTSAVIFAFGGNILFATSYHVVQRTCHTCLFSTKMAWFHFWGYQAFILLAGLGYLFGVTQGKEYAEPEWYADLWLTVVWVVYLINFLMTLTLRKEKHIYVANWFFLAFIVTIAILHLVNGLAIPISPVSVKSYSLFAGVQSALIQWWYGHNAVGFFLTAGFLGMMYYYIPKQAERPVYSYRLSIIHFWSLIFIYIWAGPHHLLYTSLPDWAQTLGMTFSIMLWMPSWGGMINGMMTLSGAWHKLRDDPILQFMIIALSFYGMSTFEGPLMSIKTVNSLSHYTNWTIGHVHAGALGWVAYISFGAIYYLVPHLWKKAGMYSTKAISLHLWISTVGIVVYITSMWVAGIMQGLMWRAYDKMGFLTYSFVEVVQAMHPYYIIRAVGGALFLVGALIMVWNIWKTIQSPDALPANSQTPAPSPALAAAE